MNKKLENAKEFLDGPDRNRKLVMGWKYLFWVGHGGWYSKICGIVWIGIVLLFSFLPWYIFEILKIEIIYSLLLILGIIGFFIGFYVALMLSYYFYIAGWQE